MIKTLIFGTDIKGYPTLLSVIIFLGGIQLLSLGVIGEYLGRIFNEVKNRPLYLKNILGIIISDKKSSFHIYG